MKINEYECSFPGKLWVAILEPDEPFAKLINRFRFKKIGESISENFNTFDDNIGLSLLRDRDMAIAGCYPVMNNDTGEYGILTIVFMIDELDTRTIAHESVHIADYFYEIGNINGESFSEGNESYAYLVGWSAGNISKTVIDYEKSNKGSRKRE